MKTVLKTAAAAIALVSMTGVAHADTTNNVQYSAQPGAPTTTTIVPFLNGPINPAYSIFDPRAYQPYTVTTPGATPEQQYTNNDIGSRFETRSATTANTDGNGNTSNAFTLNGAVSKDCSFYSGANQNNTINLGTIGVRTGNNDNVSIAFNQRDAATATINTATAGCNTNNTVKIEKKNGSDGLRNFAPGSFDSSQFTDRIPYSIAANWNGVAAGTTGRGSNQVLDVTSTQGSGQKLGGAWRSAFNMNVTMPVQPLGLVAGDYTDTVTVTLTAS